MTRLGSAAHLGTDRLQAGTAHIESAILFMDMGRITDPPNSPLGEPRIPNGQLVLGVDHELLAILKIFK